MGVECSPEIMEPPAAPVPLPLSQAPRVSAGSLAEDPEEQSSQLSPGLATESPVHLLWARRGLPAPGRLPWLWCGCELP